MINPPFSYGNWT